MEYGETSMQVAAESSMAAQRLKRARGGVGQEKAQSGQRRCGNCRKAGHNVRTCQDNVEEADESYASIVNEENGDCTLFTTF